jgi:hypothetical protein
MSVTAVFCPCLHSPMSLTNSLTYQTNIFYPKLHNILYQTTQSYVTNHTALCPKLHSLSTKLQSSVLRYAVLCNKLVICSKLRCLM